MATTLSVLKYVVPLNRTHVEWWETVGKPAGAARARGGLARGVTPPLSPGIPGAFRQLTDGAGILTPSKAAPGLQTFSYPSYFLDALPFNWHGAVPPQEIDHFGGNHDKPNHER